MDCLSLLLQLLEHGAFSYACRPLKHHHSGIFSLKQFTDACCRNLLPLFGAFLAKLLSGEQDFWVQHASHLSQLLPRELLFQNIPVLHFFLDLVGGTK